MRARRATSAAYAMVSAAGAAALVIGCVDLFHSFDDLKNACGSTEACADADADGAAPPPGDAGDGAVPTRTNFCAWTSPDARDHAEHACAWLGACESPMGQNQLGACMVQAVLAYDCLANPSMQVRGAVHDYWDKLWQARSCADVQAVTQSGAECKADGGTFSACILRNDGQGDVTTTTRVECNAANGKAPAEQCLASGQVCTQTAAKGTVGTCVGPGGPSCTNGCNGSVLHACSAGVNLGKDCAYFGAGDCVASGNVFACRPSSTERCAPADAGAGEATRDVRCEGAVAVGCASGVREIVRCDLVLLGSQCAPLSMNEGNQVATACVASPGDAGARDSGRDAGDAGVDAGRDAGALAPERCEGARAISTVRGVPVAVTCSDVGLGPCALVDTAAGKRAACTVVDGG